MPEFTGSRTSASQHSVLVADSSHISCLVKLVSPQKEKFVVFFSKTLLRSKARGAFNTETTIRGMTAKIHLFSNVLASNSHCMKMRQPNVEVYHVSYLFFSKGFKVQTSMSLLQIASLMSTVFCFSAH